MKFYIIAGEASGDLHGSYLVRQLIKQAPGAEIKAWGGDLIQQAGAQLVRHYRDLAFMGFIEVLQNLRTIFRNLKACKKDVEAFRPDALILIDYPGFNLRIAEWAKGKGLRVFYYISPQLWAWKPGRVKIIKSSVEQLFTILPFENEFYKQYQVYPEYVGHPLLENLKQFKANPAVTASLAGKKVLALLPGSRKQEITRILPILLQACVDFPEYTPVVAAAPSQPLSLYQEIIKLYGADLNIAIVENQTYSILSIASLAWVSSGTATLETALFKVPQVVCYTGNPISYWIARRLIRVKYISLVNLILDFPLIPELIQHGFTRESLIQTTRKLNMAEIQESYQKLHEILKPEDASVRVASSILTKLKLSS